MTGKKALVLVAHGSEEIETVVVVDILRRVGVHVVLASLDGAGAVKCSRDVRLLPDVDLNDVHDLASFDVVVLPGGMDGARAFEKSQKVHVILKTFEQNGKYVAAICAAPVALKAAQIGLGKRITSHPVVKQEIKNCGKYEYSENRVVTDGYLITSRGPATAFEFAFEISGLLVDHEKLEKVKQGMLAKD